MTLLRAIIGLLTLPKQVFCDNDNFYVACSCWPPMIYSDNPYDDFQNDYENHYQMIEQNWLGVWIKQTCWLSTDERLDKVR
jgi:hypothetical protein